MISVSSNWLNDIKAPSRYLGAAVEVKRNTSTIHTFHPIGTLVSITISKSTESGGVFGYTVCQKATVEVINDKGLIKVQKGDTFKVSIGVEDSTLVKSPTFYVEEVNYDEVKKTVSFVGYDILNNASKSLQKDLTITYPITLRGYAEAVAAYMGTTVLWEENLDLFASVVYTEDKLPNFSGEETLRQVLTAIAEVRGTVCYINKDEKICFKRINSNDEAVLDITKDDYFDFSVGSIKTLTDVVYTNELGEAYASTGDESGFRYILRNNPFLDNLDDIPAVLDLLYEAVGGLTIAPYTLRWRGNPALELGDLVSVVRNNDTTIKVFYLGETLTYNGGLTSVCEIFANDDEEIDSLPQTIGDAINRTSAKVDKVNNQIELVVSMTDGFNKSISDLTISNGEIKASVEEVEKTVEGYNSQIADLTVEAGAIKASVEAVNARADSIESSITSLVADAEGIKASVEGVTSYIDETMEGVNGDIETITQKVDLAMTKEDLTIEIQKAITGSAESVETTTGYRFDETGLTVSKSSSDITTTITEDGMRVDRGGETVLTANNEGVIAEDLHATT